MTQPQPALRTERLLLRPFDLADAPAVRALAGERAIADTTLGIPHPYPEGAAERWISAHAPGFAAGTEATFAITTQPDCVLVGAISLMVLPAYAQAELGYWIALPCWGMGFATEAGRAVLDYGFGALHLHRIWARHFVRNPASGRVIEKLGMRFEGIHRHAAKKWDAFEDMAHYAILVTEWPGVPQGAASES